MGILKSFWNMSLGAKINIVVVLILMTTLITTSMVAQSSVRNLTVKSGQQRAAQEAEVIQSRLEEASSRALDAAKILAGNPEMIEAITRRDTARLRAIILANAVPLGMDDIDVVDTTGARLTDLDQKSSEQEDELLLLTLLGIEASGILVEEQEEPALSLAAAIPLCDTSGTIVGGLIASQQVDDEFLRSINFSRQDVHLVVSVDDHILVQDHLDEERLGEYSTSLFEQSTSVQVDSGQATVADELVLDTDGSPYALSYVHVPTRGDMQATIGILVDLSEMVWLQRQLMVGTITITLVIGLVAVVAVSIVVRRSITVPLDNLRSAAEQMAGGDYQQRAQVTARDETGQLANAFNTMAAQLEQTLQGLEQRAAQLALINDVGGQIAATLNLSSVLARAAHLVQENFGYHHVALFTVDREQDELVMRARAGDFAHLFPPEHRLKLGQGIVGWIGRHGEALLANDVDTEPRYVNRYPEVIKTRSELSVPIQIGQEIVGVLDVQSTELNAFDEHDVTVMDTLADQIAVAIENARLYQAVQRELTERKRAEKRLEQYAAELEQANEEVKQFAYIVSHDLRVPLVNLQGFAAELRAASEVVRPAIDDVLSHVDPGQRQAVKLALQEDIPEALDFIDSSVACMDEFITAVLKLSRIGRRELKPEPIDVKAIVQATLQTLTHQIEAHQGQVTVEPLPQVVADRTSMEQVWGNILSNAVKYLDPDRPLRIEVTAERNHDEITFHVRDNGRGIAAEDMDKVFAPFRRAGRQDIPGEGMGLAYVQALVRRHGGRIWCESEPGLGTTFAFTIPSQSALSRNEIRRHVE
jgi:signal transduction histidine kinase